MDECIPDNMDDYYEVEQEKRHRVAKRNACFYREYEIEQEGNYEFV